MRETVVVAGARQPSVVSFVSIEPSTRSHTAHEVPAAAAWLASAGSAIVWLILAGSLATLALTLLAAWSPTIDVLSHGKGHLLGLVLASGAALMIGYRPVLITALGLFLTLAVHALLGLSWQGPLTTPAQAATAIGTSWKVISFNTWHANRHHRDLVEFIDRARADVVLLYEFGPDKIALLHDLERNYPYREGCAEMWQCSVVILSRHPFSAAGIADREQSGGPARVWLQFGTGPSSLTVIGAHVLRPIDGPGAHWHELDQLAAVVQEAGGRVILAGDLNATPWSSGFQSFMVKSGLQHMNRFIPTFPAGRRGLPQLAIDHIFASPGMAISDVRLGPDTGSDHRPLLATIEIPSGVPLD